MKALAVSVLCLLSSTAVADQVVSRIYLIPDWPEKWKWEMTDQFLEGEVDVTARTLDYRTIGVDQGAVTQFNLTFSEDQVTCIPWACLMQTPTTDEYGAQLGVYGQDMDTDPHDIWYWSLRAWDNRSDYAIATAGGQWSAAETVPEPGDVQMLLFMAICMWIIVFFNRNESRNWSRTECGEKNG